MPADWVMVPLAPLALPIHKLLAVRLPPVNCTWALMSLALTATRRLPFSVIDPPDTIKVAPAVPPVTSMPPIELDVAGSRLSVPALTVVKPV